MKALVFALFLITTLGWCLTKKKSVQETRESRTINKGIQPSKTGNNIRFLQRVNNQLVDSVFWRGPIIAATFHDPETGKLLKTINLRDRNPYLNIGFKIQHYEGEEQEDAIRLFSEKKINKNQLAAYLPKYLYPEIPDDWRFADGLTMCMLGSNGSDAERYLPVYYLMEWTPHPEKNFMGNYGVTLVSIIDSTGTEVYRRQFDGLLTDVAVSDDGNYLAITYSYYPEESQMEHSRLKNYCQLIYLPGDNPMWIDSTSIPYETYNIKCYAPDKLMVAKIKETDDSCFIWVVDTKTDDLYTAIMPHRKEIRAIHSITNRAIHYQAVTGNYTLMLKKISSK